MPVRSTTLGIDVAYHSSPSELLSYVRPMVGVKREREANIWLPHAMKSSHYERLKSVQIQPSPSSSSIVAPRDNRLTADEFWLSCWTTRVSVDGSRTRTLDVVLAVTQHHLGTYPVFLYSNHPSSDLTPNFIAPRVERLVNTLARITPRERVFSVFGKFSSDLMEEIIINLHPFLIGVVSLTREFVDAWSAVTNAIPEPLPFYAAKFTYCTRESLTPPRSELPEGHSMRLAGPQDLQRQPIYARNSLSTR